MQDLKQQALSLRGTRVRATFMGPGTRHHAVTGVLRFVTPKDDLIFAGEGGHDVTYPLVALMHIEDAQFVCPQCSGHVNRVFPGREDETELCADCSRKRAVQLPPPVMYCPECGSDQALFSPGDRTYACMPCHQKRRGLTGLGVERRVLERAEAECRTADTDDPRHRWFKIRGHRYHCVACDARRFTDPDPQTITQVGRTGRAR